MEVGGVSRRVVSGPREAERRCYLDPTLDATARRP